MASILPVGSRWRAQVRKRGQSIAKTFRTKGAAQAWAREKEVEIEKGIHAVELATVTVGTLIRKYREARAESGRPVKPKSNEDYILQRLQDEFESDFAAQLTTQRIVQFAQKRRKSGAGGFTIDMDISKLGTVMRHTGSLLDLALPDATGIARPTLHHLNLIEAGKRRERRPTPEEIGKIFAWFAEHPEREQAMPDLLRVAMQCAFRRGELFNLQWDDIDAENHLALVRDRKHPRQKMGNNEWVPLIGDSFEVIMRQARYPVPEAYAEKRKADPTVPPHKNEFIFRFDKGTASKYFKRACDDKGIVDLHLHDLRHEATSALFEAGWQIPEVAAVTGHKDWRNLKRYTNLDPAQVARKGRLKLVNAA
ncbi:site-specific integrase [Paraburkholderia phytofirmans]|uniref:Integrase family protein n=1 Tax=Paraburkholderia phytofirmans (strain DSM 17436 / LMG 22146 / PsJN) TaxID=398527 RepID=B2T1V7_PARPJ|nr:site-specific integrase [Paraburkholderia phytofirmans]ACD15568.1 integrase family protein [Paraburkholderia phytofirmans PsJN]